MSSSVPHLQAMLTSWNQTAALTLGSLHMGNRNCYLRYRDVARRQSRSDRRARLNILVVPVEAAAEVWMRTPVDLDSPEWQIV
jgi:hypothetical protein